MCNSWWGSVWVEPVPGMFGQSHAQVSAKGSENIWNGANCVWPKSSLKSVERLPLITVSAGAEGPWPGLLKACVLWFPCVPQCLLQHCSPMWITELLSRKAFYWHRFKKSFKLCWSGVKWYIEMCAMGQCSKRSCSSACWSSSPSHQTILCVTFYYFFCTLLIVNLYFIERDQWNKWSANFSLYVSLNELWNNTWNRSK